MIRHVAKSPAGHDVEIVQYESFDDQSACVYCPLDDAKAVDRVRAMMATGGEIGLCLRCLDRLCWAITKMTPARRASA